MSTKRKTAESAKKCVKDERGRFVKGHSGNPGGVSKEKRYIIEMCKDMSEEVVTALYSMAMNELENGSVRVMAGSKILDVAWGKPGIRKEEAEGEKYVPPQMIIQMSKEDYDEYLEEQEDAIQQIPQELLRRSEVEES